LNSTIIQNLKKVGKQSSIHFVSVVFSLFGGIIFKIYISRKLGAEALGIYSMGVGIIGLVMVFAQLGIGGAAIRFIPYYKAKKEWSKLKSFLWSASLIVIPICVIISLVYGFFGEFIGESWFKNAEFSKFAFLFGILFFFTGISGIFEAFCKGAQEVAKITVYGCFIKFPIRVVITILLVYLGYGLYGYLTAEVIASAVYLILSIRLLARKLPPELGHVPTFVKWDRELVLFTGTILSMNVLGIVSGRLDYVLLGRYLSASNVGIYNVILTITMFIPALQTSVNAVFAPMISEFYGKNEKKALIDMYKILARWTLLLSLPLILVLMIWPENFLIIFGNEFVEGKNILIVLSFGQLINISVGSVGYMLQMTGLQKYTLWSQFFSSIVALSLLFTLIPHLGLLGAGISMASSLAVSNLLNLIFLYNRRKIAPFSKKYISIVGMGFIWGAVLFTLKKTDLSGQNKYVNLFVTVFISYALALISAWFVILSKQEKGILRNNLFKRLL